MLRRNEKLNNIEFKILILVTCVVYGCPKGGVQTYIHRSHWVSLGVLRRVYP